MPSRPRSRASAACGGTARPAAGSMLRSAPPQAGSYTGLTTRLLHLLEAPECTAVADGQLVQCLLDAAEARREEARSRPRVERGYRRDVALRLCTVDLDLEGRRQRRERVALLHGARGHGLGGARVDQCCGERAARLCEHRGGLTDPGECPIVRAA